MMKKEENDVLTNRISVAVLGCGMMGQEHISYMEKYENVFIKFLCDPNPSSIKTSLSLIESAAKPEVLTSENDLLLRVHDIDLLVIATPNYLHTPQILRWAKHQNLCILVEKPVAISEKQILALRAASPCFNAKIWVAMEYRYIPAVQKLFQLLPSIGPIKSITIRENRFPFLSKVDEWNKDADKSGDTLVEKCCHFFDLFRLLSNQEMRSCTSKIHRGILANEYGYDKRTDNPFPIIDSAYVLLDFVPSKCIDAQIESVRNEEKSNRCVDSYHVSPLQQGTLGCLELCMFADGSRHQEEIIVTGLKGRLEAYLPENKVYCYQRPNGNEWTDRSKPPPKGAVKETIIDCSNLKEVYPFADQVPRHDGYHYCSTAIEWKFLLDEVKSWQEGGKFIPQVSLDDGIAAVECGIIAQNNISNKADEQLKPLVAFSTKSSEHLLNLAIDFAQISVREINNDLEEMKGV